MLEVQYRCGCFEVGIVMDNGELVCGGEGRGERKRIGRRRLIFRPIRFARVLPVDANRPRRSRLDVLDADEHAAAGSLLRAVVGDSGAADSQHQRG